jgi:ACS family sodium-dependent inorganic phosphate cotransporter
VRVAGKSCRTSEVDYNCIFAQQSASEWQMVFYIGSAIYLVGAVVYGLCASGEVQKWAIDEYRPDNKEDQCYTNTAMESDAL